MTFDLFPWRFGFVARDAILFPQGKAANTLRGALGLASAAIGSAAAQRFAPTLNSGPSGLADAPRPYVFRASHLDGVRLAPGDSFWFDLHVFDVRTPALTEWVEAFRAVGRAGLGPGRGRADLVRMWQLDGGHLPAVELGARLTSPPAPLRLDLAPLPTPVSRAVVRFVTPTELKSGGEIARRPEFEILFARVRDRVSSLAGLYGQGVPGIDFKALGARAASVRTVRCEVAHVPAERRSSRTGQTHPLGGFAGEAEYEGDLAEFIPWLKAAEWTGVGRQTPWGKGEISVAF